MPLSVGEIAPNIPLYEFCDGQHEYRQIAKRPKKHLSDFSGKPKLLVFLQQWPEFEGGETLADFINSQYDTLNASVHLLLCINSNFAAKMYGVYQEKNYKFPLYTIFTGDMRFQLTSMGTTPYMGAYLISEEPLKVLEYLPFGLDEEYLQAISDLASSASAPAIASTIPALTSSRLIEPPAEPVQAQ